MLNAAVSAYLADPSAPNVLEFGGHRLDVASAVLAQQWAAEEQVRRAATGTRRLNATMARRRMAVRTAILLAKVG